MRTPSVARRVLLLVPLLLALAPWSDQARAQDDDELDTDLLFQATLEEGVVPAAPAFVRLVRIILEPGASSPAHTHPGPEFGRVEAGVLTVEVDGPALVERRASDADEPEEANQDAPFDLERGDLITYLPGTTMAFRNNTDETVRVLAAVILPAVEEAGPRITYVDGEPDEAALEGLSSQVLGDGVASALPEQGAEVVIERVRLSAEQALPGERYPTLLSLEDGAFAFDLEEGVCQVSRTAEPGPRADMAPGDDAQLAERDAVFFPHGFGTANRGDQEGPLTYVRLVVSPAADDEALPDDGRAKISLNRVQPPEDERDSADGDGDASDDEAENDGDEEAESSAAYVNSFDVNMRAEPSTSAAIVATYQTGAAMTVTGDAVEAEGIRWVPVTSQDDGNAGYIAADLLSRNQDGTDPL